MRIRRMAAIAALGVVAVLGVAGCGSGSMRSSGGGAQNEAPMPAGEQLGAGAVGDADQSSAESGSGSPDAQGGQQPSATERKVVRTAQLSIEVDDIYAAAKRAGDVSARFGGYVADEQTDDRSASIDLKVDSKDLDAALNALTELGSKVTSRGQQAEDVTEQYVDLQARIATQRASVERVRGLLANATAINEIVQIESELTTRQANLESLERRMAALSGQTELASVSVRMFRPGNAPAAAEEDERGFLAGLGAGWRGFVASTEVVLTVLGAVLPFLLALAIPLAIVAWVLRRRRPVAATPPAPAPSAGS